MFNLFKSKNVNSSVKVDMHSHLIPEIDDGVDSYDESILVIIEMMKLGYTEFITTPHIMGDYYQNSRETILPRLDKLRNELISKNIDVKISAAAEYYLDELFVEKVKSNESLLTMGDNYVLVETSYINRPRQLESTMFDLKTSGYRPILAHPERYTYMYDSFEKYEKLFETGVLFQLNINSLSGYYSRTAQKVANKLIEKGMVHFIGTDLHGPKHLEPLRDSLGTKAYQKLSNIPLFNNELAS